MIRAIGTVAAAAFLSFASVAQACQPPGMDLARFVEGRQHVLAFRTDPQKPAVGQFFAVELAVCRRDGAAVSALAMDAQMPEHRHGMNFMPTVSKIGPNRFHADGLMLHMQGRWVYQFDLRGPAGSERLEAEDVVE